MKKENFNKNEEEINKLLKEKLEKYADNHTFKIKVENGNTYVYCNDYDFITQKLQQRLSGYFDLSDIDYSISLGFDNTSDIFSNYGFTFIIDGEDISRIRHIQKFIDNNYTMKMIEEQKQSARNTNELLNHLMKIIESNDDRFSFEWLVGGEKAEMGIHDKEKDIAYIVKIEPVRYDEKGNPINL